MEHNNNNTKRRAWKQKTYKIQLIIEVCRLYVLNLGENLLDAYS